MPAGTGGLPLAPNQETLWEFLTFLSPSDPGKSRFNILEVLDVRGELDITALSAAVSDVARRHDALRMSFASIRPEPTLRFADDPEPAVVVRDLTGLPEAGQLHQVRQICEAERNRELDLCSGPLWLLTVARLGPRRHVLIASFFHLVADGLSSQIFLRDLAAAFNARCGDGAPLAPLPVRYRDVIEARRALATDRDLRTAFHRQRLIPISTQVPFPIANPAAEVDLASEDECPFTFGQHLADGLFALAQRARTTPFNTLMAAYATLLSIRSGWRRLVIGSTTLGRDLPGSLDLIGQFTNNVYVEATVDEDATLIDVVGGVHRSMSETVRHVGPFYELARAVNPDFDRQRPWPFLHLYNAWFQSQAPSRPPIALSGLTVDWVRQEPAEPVPAGPVQAPADAVPPAGMGEPGMGEPGAGEPGMGGAGPGTRPGSYLVEVHNDLDRNAMIKRGAPCVEVRDDRLGGVILYNPDFFAAAMVAELARDYEAMVEAMVANPWQTVADLREKLF